MHALTVTISIELKPLRPRAGVTVALGPSEDERVLVTRSSTERERAAQSCMHSHIRPSLFGPSRYTLAKRLPDLESNTAWASHRLPCHKRTCALIEFGYICYQDTYILMHPACILKDTYILMYLDVSYTYLTCSVTFQENTCILIFYMYCTRIPKESKIHLGYTSDTSRSCILCAEPDCEPVEG